MRRVLVLLVQFVEHTMSTSKRRVEEWVDFSPQDDKDLVHEFVNNDGLDCLIKVGTEADQNYQNYILRGILTFALLNIVLLIFFKDPNEANLSKNKH